MPRVPNLTPVSSTDLSSGSLLPIYINEQGDARKLSLSELVSYFQQNFTNTTFQKTIIIPETGFSQLLPQNGLYQWLLIRPTGALANGTVVLPSPDVAADGQEVVITTTLQISSFTIDGNGATEVYRSPSVLAAEDVVRMKYESTTKSWYVFG